MEAMGVVRRFGMRALAALLVMAGAMAVGIIRLLKRLRRPGELVEALRRRALLWPWLAHASKLVLGTLAYNAFVFIVVEPILRRWFPPLKPWEHIQGVFAGSTRTTYDEIAPAVATILWIAGNALVITLLNRRTRLQHNVEPRREPETADSTRRVTSATLPLGRENVRNEMSEVPD